MRGFWVFRESSAVEAQIALMLGGAIVLVWVAILAQILG